MLPGKEAAAYVKNFVHEPKQVKEDCVHLTAKRIYILEGPGSLDFGGSELAFGKRRTFKTEKRSSEDKYGWWDLPRGSYIVELNERVDIPEGKTACLTPCSRLLKNEAFHPTVITSNQKDLEEVSLFVGPPGIKIKENARISKLVMW